MSQQKVRYVADVSPVQEVTLLGTADLGYWRRLLLAEDLTPVESDGRAQLVISATDARFHGIRFREWTCGLFVHSPADGCDGNGIYLVHAFNSLRSFAWIERTFFSTPYFHGQIAAAPRLPASLQLTTGKRQVFTATMSPDRSGSKPLRDETQSWSGTIFLPRATSSSAPGHCFQAVLEGRTQIYNFLEEDRLTIDSTGQEPYLCWLRESNFTPREWSIRETARHAKSKTFARPSQGVV